MPERWTRLVFGLVALASAVAAASGAPLAGLLVALAALFAVIPIPGRRSWSMLAPGLGSLALLDAASPLLLFGLVVVGTITSVVARRSGVAEAITNGASALIAIGLIEFGSAHRLIDIAGRGDLGWAEGALLAVGGVVWFLCDTVLWLVRRPQVRRSYRHETARLFSDWRIAIALVTAAVTTAVVWEYSPAWALVTALAPLAVARTLAAQAMRHEQLVELTVEALGRLPEAAGVAQQGHAVRVADLAVGMGRVAGIAGRELEELRTAALLHDAGLVEATRPEVGLQGFTTGDVARWGTDLLATDEEFLAERSIIAAVADPYRRPGADPDPAADPRAQIIKVACRFRFATETHPENDALEHMYEEASYSYDPSVIALVRPGLGLIDSTPREAVR